MHKRFQQIVLVSVLILGSALTQPAAASDVLPDNNVLMRALADELTRSLELQMEDLEKPYFIQYNAEDAILYQISASYGALTSSERDRSRRFYSQVRTGSYELDNTNFSAGGGGFFGGSARSGRSASLPIDDDYLAIRQAIWRATDSDYKDAVETLTKKRSYMEDKNLADRPNDFSKMKPTQFSEAGAKLDFDKAQWEQTLKRLSARFKKYEQIQDSSLQMIVGAGNSYVVNTEGTQVRTADIGLLLTVTAEVQADDGMKISDSLSYTGETTKDLPPIDKMLEDIDKMVSGLTEAMNAPILEQYTGPVLFSDRAAGQMFQKMLAGGVAGKVDPVGQTRRVFEGADNLEKKIGQRILPRSFQVFDNPKIKKVGDKLLFGHYRYDDDGVAAQRVMIVIDGELRNMAMSRVPTKKLSGSNGHARRVPGSGSIKASVGCLFIEDKNGVSDEQLKAALIEAAKNEGLEYGLRITSIRSLGFGSSRSDIFSFFMSMQQGRGPSLGDPIFAYKVYVDDGREELFRGCEFGEVTVRSLKKITAAGKTPKVHNYLELGFTVASPPTSIIAPAVLFEELELAKIEEEHDKLPILKAPIAR